MSSRDGGASLSSARRIRDLPAPPGLPLLGNLLQLKRESMHQTLEQWGRKYGEIYRFRIALQEYVVISQRDAVMGVLRDRPEGFRRRRKGERVFRELGADGVFTANGETWKRQRRMVQSGLDPGHVKTFFPTLVKVTGRLARRWSRAVAANEAIDLQSDLMRYTVDVTAGLAFGSDINTLESGADVIQSHLDKVLPAAFKRVMAPVPYWRYVKLPSDRRLERHVAALRGAVQGFISEARQRLEQHPELNAEPSNLIEAMLVARDAPESQLSDEDIAGNILTMLLAGEDTTANTLAWTIWFLCRHPNSLEQASREAQSVPGGRAIPASHEQLSHLNYIEACLSEAMRLKPVGPFLVLESGRSTAIGNVEIPVGTPVICLLRPAATDTQCFKDPWAFRPERWLPGSGASEMEGPAKRAVMSFGAGPRLCPGRYLAIAEMKMVIAMLLRTFEIQSVATPHGGEPREHLGFTMWPADLRMCLRASEFPHQPSAGE